MRGRSLFGWLSLSCWVGLQRGASCLTIAETAVLNFGHQLPAPLRLLEEQGLLSPLKVLVTGGFVDEVAAVCHHTSFAFQLIALL